MFISVILNLKFLIMKKAFLLCTILIMALTVSAQVLIIPWGETVSNGGVHYNWVAMDNPDADDWHWSLSPSSGFTIVGGGDGYDHVTITWTVPGTYVLILQEWDGSTYLGNDNLYIDCHPTFATISGPSTVQVYGADTYSVPANYDDYLWTVSGACGTVYSGQGTNSVSVGSPCTGYMYVKCRVKKNGLWSGDSIKRVLVQ